MSEIIRVLLLEDDAADARLVQHMLRRMSRPNFTVEIAVRLAQATQRLALGDIDVVLADLSLPDSSGLGTLTALTEAAPDLPVVVLTGNDDDSQAIEALKHGAQDYLVKGRGDDFMLSRVIRYAIERKVAERALKEARDKAEAAARAKSVFLATVGHEVRTPLNGILGMTRLLLDTPLDIKQRTFAETVVSSGELLLGLVNDILDFSRLEAEGLTLEAVPFDVVDMIDELRLMMAPRAAEKGLTLGCRFAAGVPPFLLGDLLRLRQVLLNLVGNAIKFTERGNVTMSVDPVEHLADGRIVLRFAVSDTGIGIPEQARADLFIEFSQADSSITRRFGGTGLGLAICKRLVTLMGGEIGYDSQPGQGSSFWFVITLSPSAAPMAAVEDLEDEARVACHVLLVDDNPVNREVAAGLLQCRGHKVTTLEDGMAAVEAMRLGGFHLVLLDMHMPGLDGLETARRIRALGGNAALTPLWLLTANPVEQDARLWRDAGLDGCLAKPFRVEEILSVLALNANPQNSPGESGHELILLALPDLLADLKDLGRDRMRSLVELFRNSSSTDLARILAHADAGDFAALAQSIHRMASASGSLHLTALNERCRAGEIMARAEDPAALALARGLRDLWDRSMRTLAEVVV